ncbi:MAG: choice-of-anchor Q domain-containing protein [Dehalococcoidia bacterium]
MSTTRSLRPKAQRGPARLLAVTRRAGALLALSVLLFLAASDSVVRAAGYSLSINTIVDQTYSGTPCQSGASGQCSLRQAFAEFNALAAGSSSSLTIANSTISGNTATATLGGSILNQNSVLSLTGVTVSNNSAAAGNSGGIFSDTSSAGSISLGNTIIAKQQASGDCRFGGGSAAVQDQGYNLDSDGSCGLAGASKHDLKNTDPALTSLATNNGHTQTQALQSGSPAIDAGGTAAANANCSGTDQRGLPRPQGNACDIGAYEFQPGSFQPNSAVGVVNLQTASMANPGGCNGGEFDITDTFKNLSSTHGLSDLYFKVRTLSNGNTLLNSDAGGVSTAGATLTVAGVAGDNYNTKHLLAPSDPTNHTDTTSQVFQICRADSAKFRLAVGLYASTVAGSGGQALRAQASAPKPEAKPVASFVFTVDPSAAKPVSVTVTAP